LKEEDIKYHEEWHRKPVADCPVIIREVAPKSHIKDQAYCLLSGEWNPAHKKHTINFSILYCW
jgi:hypothetical protein